MFFKQRFFKLILFVFHHLPAFCTDLSRLLVVYKIRSIQETAVWMWNHFPSQNTHYKKSKYFILRWGKREHHSTNLFWLLKCDSQSICKRYLIKSAFPLTSSPGLNLDTPWPVCLTTPEKSLPNVSGNSVPLDPVPNHFLIWFITVLP